MDKFYRDSKLGTMYEGISNMQLPTIAKELPAPAALRRLSE
jgi:alkylation response protein AidB-like acyl-CoA dehydrogenase